MMLFFIFAMFVSVSSMSMQINIPSGYFVVYDGCEGSNNVGGTYYLLETCLPHEDHYVTWTAAQNNSLYQLTEYHYLDHQCKDLMEVHPPMDYPKDCGTNMGMSGMGMQSSTILPTFTLPLSTIKNIYGANYSCYDNNPFLYGTFTTARCISTSASTSTYVSCNGDNQIETFYQTLDCTGSPSSTTSKAFPEPCSNYSAAIQMCSTSMVQGYPSSLPFMHWNRLIRVYSICTLVLFVFYLVSIFSGVDVTRVPPTASSSSSSVDLEQSPKQTIEENKNGEIELSAIDLKVDTVPQEGQVSSSSVSSSSSSPSPETSRARQFRNTISNLPLNLLIFWAAFLLQMFANASSHGRVGTPALTALMVLYTGLRVAYTLLTLFNINLALASFCYLSSVGCYLVAACFLVVAAFEIHPDHAFPNRYFNSHGEF